MMKCYVRGNEVTDMKSNTPPHVATLHLEREQTVTEKLELISGEDLREDVCKVIFGSNILEREYLLLHLFSEPRHFDAEMAVTGSD